MKKVKVNKTNSLVKQVQEGDVNAFKKLVDLHKKASFSLVCSILKDEVEAEDVLQEAYLKGLLFYQNF